MPAAITLIAPGLAAPVLDNRYSDSIALDGLSWLLGRGTRLASGPATAYSSIADALHCSAADVAARLQIDLPAAEPGYWLIADPVHFYPDRDRLLLADASQFELSAAEAATLVTELNQHFASNGLQFHAPQPKRWYLRLAEDPQLQLTPLTAAINQDINPLLPRGATALSWHALLNEIQMCCHVSKVNTERSARNLPLINGVWLSPGARLPTPACQPIQPAPLLGGDNVALAGLARLLGCEHMAHPTVAACLARQQPCIIWLDELTLPVCHADTEAWLQALLQLESAWFAPVRAALAAGALQQARIMIPGQEETLTLELNALSRWQFWRRPTKLSSITRTP